MLQRITQNLARLITPRQKINPAGEGNWHPGPYTVSGGWLPSSWGQNLNFWQMDFDPLGLPGSSIVEACIWAYIRAIAQLPGFHKRELVNGGTETITTSALSRVLRAPNAYQTPSDFLVHLIRSLLYNGNCYWVAQRNDRNEVVALHWTDPRQCRVREIFVTGQSFREVFYEIGNNPLLAFDSFDRVGIVVPARDVLHIKLATPRHPLVGETWLAALAVELMQQNALNHAVTTSATTGRPSGVLKTPLTYTVAQINELRERWRQHSADMASGGAPILTAGMEFQPLALSADDAKTIEQLKLNDRAVAGVFGVPPMLVGLADTATQKSAEAVMAEWLASGLGWLIDHIERAFDGFFGLAEIPAGREWTELDTRALLRTLYKERIEAEARAVQAGISTPNEVRRLEGLPDKDHGDDLYMQQQMVAIGTAPPVAPTPAAPTPPPDEPTPADEQASVTEIRTRFREIQDLRI